MENINELTKLRAGRKQSLTKKQSSIETLLNESPTIDQIRGWITELENSVTDIEAANAECIKVDSDNLDSHKQWIEEVYSKNSDLVNRLKQIFAEAQEDEEHKGHLNVVGERVRRITIERDNIVGHLCRIINKSKIVNPSSTEKQLNRLKETIKVSVKEVVEKNNDLAFIKYSSYTGPDETILDVLEEAEATIEHIETQIDGLIKVEPELSVKAGEEAKSYKNELIKLKRISLPTFSGDKKEYPTWRATFNEFVGKSATTPEFKLLQLKEVLVGEAAQLTQGLGYSAEAYECVLERLERKFGGSRRENNLVLEEIDAFVPVRAEFPADLEKFADLLENLVLKFSRSGREAELGSGMLYVTLQKKLPIQILTAYQRWIFDSGKDESILTLKEYVMREAEFHAVASETARGVSDLRFTPNVATCRPVKCSLCDNAHHIEKCVDFRQMCLKSRKKLAFSMNLCFKCLARGHHSDSCPEHGNNRHYLLRRNGESRSVAGDGPQQSTIRTKSAFTLRIIPVIIKNGSKELKINALLDDGSQQTFINRSVTSYLGISEADPNDIDVKLIGGKMETIKGAASVQLEVLPVDKNSVHLISALTTSRVTGDLRGRTWIDVGKKYRHLRGIPLENFCSKKVDILIGLDNPEMHVSLEERTGNPGEPLARLTPLGWSLIGPVAGKIIEKKQSHFTRVHFINNQNELQEIKNNIEKLWEVENMRDEYSNSYSRADEVIITNTMKSIKKVDGNRYQVSIPWNANKKLLTDNSSTAYKRLRSTEKQLLRKVEVGRLYQSVMEEYIRKGYIRRIDTNKKGITQHLMPHFPVVDMSRDTTKVRVVFDASAKENGVSLNDAIDPGPNLQRDLMDVLLRFRKNPIAIAADISEMFLQVELKEEDRAFHRFLWRDLRMDDRPEIYEFSRLVFGGTASPFLAQFVSIEHAKRHQKSFPRAAESIIQSTYMDDTLDSVDSSKNGICLYKDLKVIWNDAGMKVHKWLTNDKEVLAAIPLEERAKRIDLESSIDCKTKTLGLTWHADDDVFRFENKMVGERIDTKRKVLKHTAAIFDPLGFISPLLIKGKMIIQETWKLGLDWDEKLPEELLNRVDNFFVEMQDLHKLEFQRYLKYSKNDLNELHVFADSSEDAYTAVAYMRNKSISTTEVSLNLVASKTKVAPLKAISMPRLELTAAELGVKLATKICNAIAININEVVFWCDSQDVLGWIYNESRNFRSFVAHKIGKIQYSVSPQQWRYVPTQLNPADVATRGTTTVKDLLNINNVWLQGPSFLKMDKSSWPLSITVPSSLPEQRPGRRHAKTAKSIVSIKCVDQPVKSIIAKSIQCGSRKNVDCNEDYGINTDRSLNANVLTVISDDPDWRLNPDRFSSFLRLLRTRAWVNRFLKNISTKIKMKGPLTPLEMETSKLLVIRDAQREAFPEEISNMQNKKILKKNSVISALNPKLDQNNIMRSNSRLVNVRNLNWNSKHPIILPKNHAVTRLIIKQAHEESKHVGGTNHILAQLSREFWILSAREAIRKWEKECNECKRRNARRASQIMAPLPEMRTEGSLKAFTNVGCDFAGPFITIQGRGKTRLKRYLCLFTCCEVRAVHLEMCHSLDTNSFINAFWRFTARRGFPSNIVTDNGRNFVKAEKELQALVRLIDFAKVQEKTAHKAVNWHFNPPYEPHSGGIFEIMIKSSKRAMKSQLQDASVTDEELLTVIVITEGILNSRPITYQSANSADLTPLTPNHFLHGRAGEGIAISSAGKPTMRRWRRLQEIVNGFWQRWMKELIPSLAGRKKWHREKRDIEVGDIALMISPDNERGKWPLGIIKTCTRGKDERVRRVEIEVDGKSYDRGIKSICPLELSN